MLMLVVCGSAALRITEPNIEPAGGPVPHDGVRRLRAGLAAYVMFGLGYIGYMTFVIAWMRDHGASTQQVIAVWCTFGAASLLGPWLWRRPLQHWIPGRMLAAAMALLAVGALLPLLHAGMLSMLLSAALFGASMWNIPGSVTNLAKRALPKPAWGSAVADLHHRVFGRANCRTGGDRLARRCIWFVARRAGVVGRGAGARRADCPGAARCRARCRCGSGNLIPHSSGHA